MPLNIRNEDVNRLAERLAAVKRLNKTEAVKLALENELQRAGEVVPLWERSKLLRDGIAAYPDSGLEADRAFFDDLSGDN
ncbi:type II toxin-antitoxin system VapB family antitoxin [Pararhizobium sp.]|uniref:type II toxin-antitoxin system VapB family antitoxin n=1 Tax=Pararhizobium sp. TaxID=1977563 RepID=UPI00271E7FCD|nr:type II toxin-antitoxin system VapB family antitoxin [Pararhizobium sp.]MDO9417533.1 type II toxin-antitoxin system VapB family antitoxin [Pararhizobium sp.]